MSAMIFRATGLLIEVVCSNSSMLLRALLDHSKMSGAPASRRSRESRALMYSRTSKLVTGKGDALVLAE